MACIYKYSLIGILLNFASFALAVPSNALVMTVLGTLFSALGWSFAGIGLFGIQLELIGRKSGPFSFHPFRAGRGVRLSDLLPGRKAPYLPAAGAAVPLRCQAVCPADHQYARSLLSYDTDSVSEILRPEEGALRTGRAHGGFYISLISLMEPLSWKSSHSAMFTAWSPILSRYLAIINTSTQASTSGTPS